MTDREEAKVEIDGLYVDIQGEDGEEVKVGPGGVHIVDGDSEVNINWSGIRIRDAKTNLNITVWKPLLGCAVAMLVFAALLTATVVGVVRLMMP